MSIKPLSLDGSTSGTVKTGSGRNLPFSIIRTRPGRSVTSMLPLGSQTRAHGTSSPAATVSTRNRTSPFAVEMTLFDDASDVPPPQPNAATTKRDPKRLIAFQEVVFDLIFSFVLTENSHCYRDSA